MFVQLSARETSTLTSGAYFAKPKRGLPGDGRRSGLGYNRAHGAVKAQRSIPLVGNTSKHIAT